MSSESRTVVQGLVFSDLSGTNQSQTFILVSASSPGHMLYTTPTKNCLWTTPPFFPLSLDLTPAEVIQYINASVQRTSACVYMLDLLSGASQGLPLCGAGCLWD